MLVFKEYIYFKDECIYTSFCHMYKNDDFVWLSMRKKNHKRLNNHKLTTKGHHRAFNDKQMHTALSAIKCPEIIKCKNYSKNGLM